MFLQILIHQVLFEHFLSKILMNKIHFLIAILEVHVLILVVLFLKFLKNLELFENEWDLYQKSIVLLNLV